MAISNNTTGYRPGVCTSTTRPTAPYEGQMIYETDTNRVLIWDNAAWVMVADTDTPPGTQLIKIQTLSGTSTQINDCFTSEFDSYRIVFSSLTSSTVDFITMRLVTGTTPNQTSNYYSSGLQVNTSGTVAGISGGGAISYWTTHVVGFTTASGGSIDIYNPKLPTATSFSGQGIDARTDGAPHRSGGGFFNGTTSFDGFWVSTVNGTFTLGGTVRVYGYRN